MNVNDAASYADGGSRLRARLGIGLFLIVVALVGVVLAFRVTGIFNLFQNGLRRDAILLLAVRNLSLAVFIVCGAYLLSSVSCNWGKAGRISAVVVLVVSGLFFGVSAAMEQRMRSQVQNNLDQLRRALENYELNQRPGGSSDFLRQQVTP